MYEIKKYLKLDESLNVKGAIDYDGHEKLTGPSFSLYKVVHIKPFKYSEESVKKFADLLFQDFVKISDLNVIVTKAVNNEVIEIDLGLSLNNVPFLISFNEKVITISGNMNKKFELSLPINYNKNNFTALRRIKKEIDSLTDWHFLSNKMNEKLKESFPNELDFGVGGFIKTASPESKGGEREVGEFVVTPNTNGDIRSCGIRNISFKLDGKDLSVNNLAVDSPPFNLRKDIKYYKDESIRLGKVFEKSEKIYDEVRWVIFSSRREERLKKLLDKK